MVIHIVHFSLLNNRLASVPSSKPEYFCTTRKCHYISVRGIHIDIHHRYNRIDFSLIHVPVGNTGGWLYCTPVILLKREIGRLVCIR
jgi:hypothetical protein